MKIALSPVIQKNNFEKSGYVFLVLIPLVLLGFWKTYFSKFFGAFNSISSYMIFHFIMMATWITMLIVQPILIRKNKLRTHRFIGKISYFTMPLLIVSIVLMINLDKTTPAEELTFVNAQGLRDLFALVACYIIAILNRRERDIHARAMIGTGIAILDPIIARVMNFIVIPILMSIHPNPDDRVGSLIKTIFYIVKYGAVLVPLVILIYRDRNQNARGRWIFPSLLVIYGVSHLLLVYQNFILGKPVHIPVLDDFVRWFQALPLT
ncbi:MAG: hypothetical protein C5B52_03120 [Bacteroidetes bacterium]|nr:MAG: hypothetical protein C5B52_03120 [Bacteroidota bacterium]